MKLLFGGGAKARTRALERWQVFSVLRWEELGDRCKEDFDGRESREVQWIAWQRAWLIRELGRLADDTNLQSEIDQFLANLKKKKQDPAEDDPRAILARRQRYVTVSC